MIGARKSGWFVVAAAAMMCSGFAALAQSVDKSDLEAANLTEIDRLIADIERQIALVEATTGKDQSTLSVDNSDTSDVEDSVLVTDRNPRNPLCLEDSEYGLTTIERLQAYFDANDEVLQTVAGDRAAFLTLRDASAADTCDQVTLLLLERMSQTIGRIDRSQLVDVAFHLEGCWPDSTAEADASASQFDTFYRSAREQRRELASTQRAVREASSSCS